MSGRILLVLAWAAAGPAPAAEPSEPLSCRLLRVEPVAKEIEGAILAVEVRNGGARAAEPIRFTVAPKGAAREGPIEVRRVDDPVAGRAGRVVPPGGAVTYLLSVPRAARALAGAAVRVTGASFPAGTGVAKPPVVVEGIDCAQEPDEAGVPVWRTTARLRNLLDRPVDALFLARLREPPGARVLVARRLGPRESVAWVFREAPLLLHELRSPRLTGVAARSLELVDWSVIAGDGRAEGEALLRGAWENWARWEEPFPAPRGRFRFRSIAGGAAGAPPSAVSGAFSLDAGGLVTIVPESPVDPTLGDAVRRAIGEAFADLRRPAAEAAVAAARPALVEEGAVARVLCEAPPSGERGPAQVFRIEQGMLRGWEAPDAPRSIFERWTLEAAGARFLVTGRDLFQEAVLRGERPCDRVRFRYGDVDGRIVPLSYARAASYAGGAPDETTVEFDAISFDEGAVPALPVEAPPEVRAAWEDPYRHPAAPVDFAARFVAENAGTDAVWAGARRASGRLRLDGFAGFGNFLRSEVEVEGSWPEETRRAIAAALIDRLLLWARRDFSARAPFEIAFRGASVAPREGAAGVYEVTNGPCATIVLRDGRIESLDAPSLLGGRLGFETVGASLVHASLERGPARMTGRLADVGGGWILPVEMRFERIFDAAWGPERILLSEARITPRGG